MKKSEKKIRKIGKEEFDNYNVDGYKIGQSVRLNNEYDDHTIYEIVALDMQVEEHRHNILLDNFDSSKCGIKDFKNLPIVYKKGAKKKKYSKWIKSDDILEVVDNGN